jgi:hypothetical protein
MQRFRGGLDHWVCGNPERHEYELYLAVEDIDHSRTKTKSPQTNGICERFHKTVLNEFYRVAFRKKVYRSIDELQADLVSWIKEYNETRPHRGRWFTGLRSFSCREQLPETVNRPSFHLAVVFDFLALIPNASSSSRRIASGRPGLSD